MTLDEIFNRLRENRDLIASLRSQIDELNKAVEDDAKALDMAEYEAGIIPFYAGQKVTILEGYVAWSRENQDGCPIRADGKMGIVHYCAPGRDIVNVDMPDGTKASWVLVVPIRFLKAVEEKEPTHD